MLDCDSCWSSIPADVSGFVQKAWYKESLLLPPIVIPTREPAFEMIFGFANSIRQSAIVPICLLWVPRFVISAVEAWFNKESERLRASNFLKFRMPVIVYPNG